MGGAKQFHNWPTATGSQPLAAASYDAVAGVCEEMIVVLGHRASEVAGLLRGRSFHRVDGNPDGPMFESILVGLRAAQDLDEGATVLLHLGDHPEIAAVTLSRVLEVSRTNTQRAVLPEYRGRGGHPVLIPPAVIKLVLASDGRFGLRQFWMDHPECCVRTKVDDPSAVHDIDYVSSGAAD